MNDSDRLQLQKMITANNVEDQTELIRELKHSYILQDNINSLLQIKQKYRIEDAKFDQEAMSRCAFLFTYYTDIYNKVKKDELDLKLLNKFLNILRMIENSELDQHEGAFMVGTILKEIYVDSALKKAEKLNSKEPEPEVKPPVDISWKQYKQFLAK
jgi:hypothetical protein